MKTIEILKLWEEFVINYLNKYKSNNELKWNIELDKLKEYINIHKTLPLRNHNDKKIKYLADWIHIQKTMVKKIMNLKVYILINGMNLLIQMNMPNIFKHRLKNGLII